MKSDIDIPIVDSATENTSQPALLSKIKQKNLTVCVIGLGYVGLPFLVEKAKIGLSVIGLDYNSDCIVKLQQGQSYIHDVPSDVLADVNAKGKTQFTTDYAAMKSADVIVICVPTPIDKNHCPDLSYVEAVCDQIAIHLQPGQLVCLESTTYPGTTEEVVLPLLETSGLKAERDFYLAYSPERVDPGNHLFSTKNTNKIVGAVGERSLAVAHAFYQLAIESVVTVSSAKIAELVKCFENTFRSVNIALVNQMCLLCDKMDVDVWEMLDAAFTKPFGILPFYPGPGVGGHCIPIDPLYLQWKAKEYNFDTRLINLASDINQGMPEYVLSRVIRALNQQKKPLNSSKVLLIGMAYKANLPDYRESPALNVFSLLKDNSAQVSYVDSYVPVCQIESDDYSSQALTAELLQQQDIVIITTYHRNVDYAYIQKHANLVLDTRCAIKERFANVIRL